MKQISTNAGVNLQKNSVNSSVWLLILCKNKIMLDLIVEFFPLGLNTLDNARENEINTFPKTHKENQFSIFYIT